MADLDFVKRISSTAVYNRGLRYYKQGYISNYSVNRIKKNIRISGTVSGNYYYDLTIDLNISDTGELYYKSRCTCPYDWGGECKHVVALLIKFFEEDYDSFKAALLQERDYGKLLQLSQEREENKVIYFIKGLDEDNLLNFKIYLEADPSYGESNREIVNNDLMNLFSVDRGSLSGFSARDRYIIQYMEDNSYSKGRQDNSYLLPKTELNFLFLKGISAEGSLYFFDSREKVKIGDEVKLPMEISGNEYRVSVEIISRDRLYFGENHEIAWNLIGNTVNPIKSNGLIDISEELRIPEENRGEFLFEILPALKSKYRLELKGELKNYKLIKIEPLIRLGLDHVDSSIYSSLELKIGEEVYHGAEILSINTDKKEYYKCEGNDKLWYLKDYSPIKKLIEFLEEYEFHVRPDCFFIKDKIDIQEFITNGLSALDENWQVSYSDYFNQIKVESIELKPVIEFLENEGDESDSGKINWFEFKITYDLGGKTFNRQEILKMIRYNKHGEAYIELDNNYYFLQESREETNIKEIMNIADQEDDIYKSSFYNILYYKKLIEESEISFQGNRVFNKLGEDISSENLLKEVAIPEMVEDLLRNYQKEGYYWLRFLNKYYFSGILADDMGLGKTIQTLTLLKSLKLNKPALIVCPRTLIYNWGEEIDKFFPGTNYLVYYGTPDNRENMLENISNYEFIITSYSILSRDYQELHENIPSFSYCILDEAQHIKNYRTKRARNVKKVKAEHRLALTGTPIENSVEELWSIFDFLMSGYLGTYSYFKNEYLNPIVNDNNKEKLNKLRKRVAPFILRRSKVDVLKELPEKLLNFQYVEMTKLQRDTYQLVLEEVKGEIWNTVKEKGFDQSKINILAALTKMRQICNHPSLILDNINKNVESGKLDTLLEMVEDGINSGHKIVVFSQFVKMLKLIKERFDITEIEYEYLDGSTHDRMKRVNRFNNNRDINVFLLSLKAGGVGLNLTSADIVIHVDPWWNPMVERQATDRVHRIGQENRVIVYKMITKGTVEEKMIKLQKRKEKVFNSIIESSKNDTGKISWEEIQDLLEFDE